MRWLRLSEAQFLDGTLWFRAAAVWMLVGAVVVAICYAAGLDRVLLGVLVGSLVGNALCWVGFGLWDRRSAR